MRIACSVWLLAGVLLAMSASSVSAAGSSAQGHRARPRPQAPDGPPLLTGSGSVIARADRPGGQIESAGLGGEGEAEDASASAPSSVGDPLAHNGLASPLCIDSAATLAGESRRNCETSHFTATPAPTANYALDVHIDAGLLGVNSATLIQDYLIAPIWMGLVWIVHALLVALEYCFTLDLSDDGVLKGLATSLRETRATFTQPWLAAALALGSVGVLYHGVLHRRVTEALGQVVAMLTMMAVGLSVMMDPTGTVGALGHWSDQISLGTLGAVADGSPAGASRTLTDSMRTIFASAVGEPWCFLEFGDVRWCTDPARLDPRLRATAQSLAKRGQSPRLLREAKTNGELFLALPANQAARNSINSSSSLLRVMCADSDATACHGSAAAVAEFRTASGTYARLEGLVLIGLGALGLILLLTFLALHLLGSGVVSLFYLLLAPAVVLAPAFGERGRALFKGWAARLLGSVTSKVLYALLLGVVLLLSRLLMGLSSPGFWTRWALLSAFWWGSFRHRHQALAIWDGQHSTVPRSHGAGALRWALARALPTPSGLARSTGRALNRVEQHATATPREPRHRPPRPVFRMNNDEQDAEVPEWRERPDVAEHSEPAEVPVNSPRESEPEPRFEPDAELASPVMRDIFEYLDGRKDYMGWVPPDEELEAISGFRIRRPRPPR